MAVVGKRVTVGTTPTRLDTTTPSAGDPTVGSSLLIRNRHATASVYLGASDVTTATGYELLADEALPLDLARAEQLFAICASGTVTCHVLEVGV